MSLSIGIVGLPNVGKSTLFNALTKNNVLAANYPFATIEPNVGVVGVPDERLAKLAKIFSSEKLLPATVSFVDIAGIVKGASEGAAERGIAAGVAGAGGAHPGKEVRGQRGGAEGAHSPFLEGKGGALYCAG